MPLQNFVDGQNPVISAAWLNAVDVFLTTLFAGATTATAARTAINAAKLDGVASQVFLVAAATLDDHAMSRAAGDVRYAALAGLSTQSFAALKTVITSGALGAIAAGTTEYDGTAIYFTPAASSRAVQDISYLTSNVADFVGTDVATAQPVFEAARDAITVPGSTSYLLDALYIMTRAAGAVSHTIGLLFAGTASFTSMAYAIGSTSSTGNVLTAVSSIYATSAASVVATAASTSTTENNVFRLKGILRVNSGGTIVPQIIYSAAPGGVPTFKANSYLKLSPIGSNTFGSIGNWS